jgi:hypothetical protein
MAIMMHMTPKIMGRFPVHDGLRFVGWIATGVMAAAAIAMGVTAVLGRKIGEIEDVLVSQDGKITGFIVEVGGFLGMGKHYVAVSEIEVRDSTRQLSA